MGGGGSKTVEYQKTDPWAGQQPYLSKAFSEADQIYNANKDKMPLYDGEFVAQPTQQSKDFTNAGLDRAAGGDRTAIDQTYGMSNALMGAGFGGQLGAMGQLFGAANANNTANNINAAGQYADNPYVSGMVDAATQDARRAFSEQQMPGIDRAAAAAGTRNSTRTDIAKGIAERGLAENIANTSAAMRGNLYQNGLSLAQADNAQKLGAMQAAGNLAQGMSNAGLGGMQSGSEMSKNNAVVGQLYQGTQQAHDQAAIDNAMQKAEFEFNQPYANLQNYWNVVGDKSWGSEGYKIGKTQNQPSAMSTVGSAVGMMAALFCDERIKTNVKFDRSIGRINFYTFEYTNAPGETVFGPMAQEIEQIDPTAVMTVGGLKVIDRVALTNLIADELLMLEAA